MIIAFIGSVFSPYYARSRRAGPADPLRHCAMNVALYGRRGGRWAMSEYPRDRVALQAREISIGGSSLAWDGTTLVANIDESCAPWPLKLRGTVRLHPQGVFERAYALDPSRGEHLWQPIAPHSRVEVHMAYPDVRWSGNAYLDSNCGTAPLESAFRRWDWARATLGDGTLVNYDVTGRDTAPHAISLLFGRSGGVRELRAQVRVPLPSTRWGVARQALVDPASGAPRVSTLEDTPFYARSLVHARMYGEDATAMHESLSLERFRSGWVQRLLPFRMRRVRR